VSESAKYSVAGFLTCSLGLAVLASLAMLNESFRRLDARLVNRMVEQLPAGGAASVIVQLGDPVPQAAILLTACLLSLALGRPRQAAAAVVLVVGANLTTQLLKIALSQPRPQPLLGYYQIGPSAFPSGHVTAMMAMTLALVLLAPRWWPAIAALGALLTVAVAWSVIVLHHHFPSDALAGVLVALAWFFAVLVVEGGWRGVVAVLG
jgi:membrane-associated phospholipid phosphatase